MQKFNCRKNTDKSKSSVFWSKPDWVIEMDTGNGAYKLRNYSAGEETTKNVLYVPNVLSNKELVDKAKNLLTKIDGRKELILLCLIFCGCTCNCHPHKRIRKLKRDTQGSFHLSA